MLKSPFNLCLPIRPMILTCESIGCSSTPLLLLRPNMPPLYRIFVAFKRESPAGAQTAVGLLLTRLRRDS